ncbi:MAG TPA: MgtC/SapB family protein [Clostridia bacterium]|nr:MgtC/SapB family protein [Clostridia bacterium]
MGWEMVLRLVLALIIGGTIGAERERSNRPAGFRTHTLVCVGSALVFLTSLFIFERYHHLVNLDPTRLPAQVVSGIGFLGAGTIIHYGSNVRGLTSAATLWVVACLGLAIGAGFYWGALATWIAVYIILIFLKRIELSFLRNKGSTRITLELRNTPEIIGKVADVMGAFNIKIREIRLLPSDDQWAVANFLVDMPRYMDKEVLMGRLSEIEGVQLD